MGKEAAVHIFWYTILAFKILSKHLWIADKGGPSGLELDKGLTHLKKKSASYKMLLRVSDLDGVFGTS